MGGGGHIVAFVATMKTCWGMSWRMPWPWRLGGAQPRRWRTWAASRRRGRPSGWWWRPCCPSGRSSWAQRTPLCTCRREPPRTRCLSPGKRDICDWFWACHSASQKNCWHVIRIAEVYVSDQGGSRVQNIGRGGGGGGGQAVNRDFLI